MADAALNSSSACTKRFLKVYGTENKIRSAKNNPELLEELRSDANDRTYQFWKRRALSIELRTDKVYHQKLDYIHWNPVKAAMCKLPEEYKYSSAKFYHTGIDNPSASSGGISYTSSGLTPDQWLVEENTNHGVKHQPRLKNRFVFIIEIHGVN